MAHAQLVAEAHAVGQGVGPRVALQRRQRQPTPLVAAPLVQVDAEAVRDARAGGLRRRAARLQQEGVPPAARVPAQPRGGGQALERERLPQLLVQREHARTVRSAIEKQKEDRQAFLLRPHGARHATELGDAYNLAYTGAYDDSSSYA